MIKTLYLKPLVAAAGLAFSVGALAAPWTVVPETSSVGFVGTQQGTKFNGRFQTFTAQIDLDAADPTKGSIVGTVQLDSVNTRDHDRDASLLDKDWFNAKEFPRGEVRVAEDREGRRRLVRRQRPAHAEGPDEAGRDEVHADGLGRGGASSPAR